MKSSHILVLLAFLHTFYVSYAKDIKLSHITVLLASRSPSNPEPGGVKITAFPQSECFEWKTNSQKIAQFSQFHGCGESRTSANAVTIRTDSDAKAGKVSTWITAISKSTKEKVLCEVFVDSINKLQILSSTKRINVGDYESLRVQAFNEKGDVFDTVEGMNWQWHSSINTKLEPVSKEEAKIEAKIGDRSVQPFKGMTSGSVDVTVRLPDSAHDNPDTMIQMYVVEPLFLSPPRFSLLPACQFKMALETKRSSGNFVRVEDSNMHHYSWDSSDEAAAVVNSVGVVVGQASPGSRSAPDTVITVRNIDVKELYQQSTVSVRTPTRIDVFVVAANGKWCDKGSCMNDENKHWWLIEGQKYTLDVHIFYKDGYEERVFEDLLCGAVDMPLTFDRDIGIETVANADAFSQVEEDVEENDVYDYHLSTPMLPGDDFATTTLTVRLNKASSTLGGDKTEATFNLDVTKKVTVAKPLASKEPMVVLPPAPCYRGSPPKYQLQVTGGSGKYTYRLLPSSNSATMPEAVQLDASTGKVWARKDVSPRGRSIINVCDRYNPHNCMELPVYVVIPDHFGVAPRLPSAPRLIDESSQESMFVRKIDDDRSSFAVGVGNQLDLELMAKPQTALVPNAVRYSTCEGLKFKIDYLDPFTRRKLTTSMPFALQRTQALESGEQTADGSCSVAVFDSLRAGILGVEPSFDTSTLPACLYDWELTVEDVLTINGNRKPEDQALIRAILMESKPANLAEVQSHPHHATIEAFVPFDVHPKEIVLAASAGVNTLVHRIGSPRESNSLLYAPTAQEHLTTLINAPSWNVPCDDSSVKHLITLINETSSNVPYDDSSVACVPSLFVPKSDEVQVANVPLKAAWGSDDVIFSDRSRDRLAGVLGEKEIDLRCYPQLKFEAATLSVSGGGSTGTADMYPHALESEIEFFTADPKIATVSRSVGEDGKPNGPPVVKGLKLGTTTLIAHIPDKIEKDFVKKGFRAELPVVVEFQSFEIHLAGEMLVVGESTIATVKTSVGGNAGADFFSEANVEWSLPGSAADLGTLQNPLRSVNHLLPVASGQDRAFVGPSVRVVTRPGGRAGQLSLSASVKVFTPVEKTFTQQVTIQLIDPLEIQTPQQLLLPPEVTFQVEASGPPSTITYAALHTISAGTTDKEKEAQSAKPFSVTQHKGEIRTTALLGNGGIIVETNRRGGSQFQMVGVSVVEVHSLQLYPERPKFDHNQGHLSEFLCVADRVDMHEVDRVNLRVHFADHIGRARRHRNQTIRLVHFADHIGRVFHAVRKDQTVSPLVVSSSNTSVLSVSKTTSRDADTVAVLELRAQGRAGSALLVVDHSKAFPKLSPLFIEVHVHPGDECDIRSVISVEVWLSTKAMSHLVESPSYRAEFQEIFERGLKTTVGLAQSSARIRLQEVRIKEASVKFLILPPALGDNEARSSQTLFKLFRRAVIDTGSQGLVLNERNPRVHLSLAFGAPKDDSRIVEGYSQDQLDRLFFSDVMWYDASGKFIDDPASYYGNPYQKEAEELLTKPSPSTGRSPYSAPPTATQPQPSYRQAHVPPPPHYVYESGAPNRATTSHHSTSTHSTTSAFGLFGWSSFSVLFMTTIVGFGCILLFRWVLAEDEETARYGSQRWQGPGQHNHMLNRERELVAHTQYERRSAEPEAFY